MKQTMLTGGMLVALAGCNAAGELSIPAFAIEPQWHAAEAISKQPLQEKELERWWESLRDPTLNQLVDEALQHNHDLHIAEANLLRARALRRVAASDFYPKLDAGAGASKEGVSQAAGSGNGNGEKERNRFDAGLDASWELDVFGRVQQSVAAADAGIDQATASRDEVQLAMIAELVRNYYVVRGYQKRIAITERTIGLLAELQQVAQAQLDAGTVTELDVARARGEKETVAATLPSLEAEKQAAIYRLSVLAGGEPQSRQPLFANATALPMPPDTVPAGLRSDLLTRRPDMRRARAELAEAVALKGVAEADLFPRLSLTGALGSSAALFSDLFTTGGIGYLIGSAVQWSVFDGGSIRATIDAADADEKAALLRYEQAVLLALEDAEGALLRYGKAWQRLRALQVARASRQEAFDIARLRYEAGEDEFTVMLDAERALVTVDDELVQAEMQILTQLTQVYKALGGGWQAKAAPLAATPQRTKTSLPASESDG